MENRQNLGSRLGFILLSAGCAIGLGNVWKFPYMTGHNGGGAFVLIYLAFLIMMGVPIMTMEYAVGRASRKSILPAYRALQPKGARFHWMGWFAILGNYVILMFYSVVTGWLLYYVFLTASGRFVDADGAAIEAAYGGMMGSPRVLVGCMLLVMLITVAICAGHLQNSVERVTKVMMSLLLGIMVVLAVRCMTLPGGGAGLAFYLKPSLANMREAGIGNVIYGAMTQSFFTLSLGMGGMEIFGSYIDKRRSLAGEALVVAGLDTFVAITAGLIIFPACFAYGIDPDSGPRLIFLTLPAVFVHMAHGRIWGSLFFLFLFFAALSTMVGVFENVASFAVDLRGTSRKTSALVNGAALALLSIPCALGFNVWSFLAPLGPGTVIMDAEDFFVSNLVLPIGSLVICLFCTWKYGWGFDAYMKEVNLGEGLKVSPKLRVYFQYILPALLGFLVIYGLIAYFVKP